MAGKSNGKIPSHSPEELKRYRFFSRHNLYILFVQMNGRIGRASFIKGYTLLQLIVYIVIGFISVMTSGPSLSDSALQSIAEYQQAASNPQVAASTMSSLLSEVAGFGLSWTLYFAFLFSIPLTIKRLHDLDYDGWWTILGFVPFIQLIFYTLLMAIHGEEKPNRFGPPEKIPEKFKGV